MPNTTTNYRPRAKKKQPVPKREYAYSVLFGAGHLLWMLVKVAAIVAIALLTMLLFIVGSMTRGAN